MKINMRLHSIKVRNIKSNILLSFKLFCSYNFAYYAFFLIKLTSIFQNVKSEITVFKCVSFAFMFNFGNYISKCI